MDRLIPFLEFARKKSGKVAVTYAPLRSPEFRAAIGAVKQGGRWFVSKSKTAKFRREDWTNFGHRVEHCDPNEYIYIAETELFKEHRGSLIKMFWKSSAVREALGGRKFRGSKRWMVKRDLLSKFNIRDWRYVAHADDFQNIHESRLIPLSQALSNFSRSPFVVRQQFYKSHEIRELMGGVQFGNDPRWWVDRDKAAAFNPDEWTMSGRRRKTPARPRKTASEPKPPTTKQPFIVPEGYLTVRQAAKQSNYSVGRFKALIRDPEIQIKLGLVRVAEANRVLIDESKLASWRPRGG